MHSASKNISLLLAIYCSLFFLLRIFAHGNLSPDEAEQFFNAQEFHLSYSSQAPLFTWLLIPITKVFGNNYISINLLKYLSFLGFLYYFYQSCKKLIPEQLQLTCLASLSLIPLYSYNYHKDLTHTVLLTAIAAWSFYIFNSDKARPILFGISIGLGILAKYNFLLLALALLISCFFNSELKAKYLNLKNLSLIIFSSLLVCSPHFCDLYFNNFSSFSHAFRKASTASIDFLSIKNIFLIFKHVFLIQAPLLLVFLFFRFKKQKHYLNITYCGFTVLTLTIIVFKQMTFFHYRWLAPVLLLVPLLIFLSIKEPRTKISSKLFLSICIGIISIALGVNYLYAFHPDQTGKKQFSHLPYKSFAEELNANYLPLKTIFISHNRLLLANLSHRVEGLETLWLEELSHDYFISEDKSLTKYKKTLNDSPKDKLVILETKDLNKNKEIANEYFQLFKSCQKLEKIKKNLNHSKKFRTALHIFQCH